MTHEKLFCHFLKLYLMEPERLDPIIPSYPMGFDPNVNYRYHAGTPSYSIEDCKPFRDKVQDLIDTMAITFAQGGQN